MKTRFPGFKACMKMMRKRDPQTQEDGFHLLLPHAREHLASLIAEFEAETDPGLRCWLLELIGEARAPEATAILAENLRSPDEGLRSWAIRGLHVLKTMEARQLLWNARSYSFETEEQTEAFLRELAEITGR